MFRSAWRPPVLSSPALLRRTAELSTYGRPSSAQTFLRGDSFYALRSQRSALLSVRQEIIRLPHAAAELFPAFRRSGLLLLSSGSGISRSVLSCTLEILIRPPQAPAKLVSAAAPAFACSLRAAVALAASGTARFAPSGDLFADPCRSFLAQAANKSPPGRSTGPASAGSLIRSAKYAPLRPALWLILFDLARASPRPNRISRRSGLRFAPNVSAVGLARPRHGPFRSIRRLILCACSFLADQRISLLRFAPAVQPSARARFCSAPPGVLQY